VQLAEICVQPSDASHGHAACFAARRYVVNGSFTAHAKVIACSLVDAEKFARVILIFLLVSPVITVDALGAL
jgi:hypothetical protein